MRLTPSISENSPHFDPCPLPSLYGSFPRSPAKYGHANAHVHLGGPAGMCHRMRGWSESMCFSRNGHYSVRSLRCNRHRNTRFFTSRFLTALRRLSLPLEKKNSRTPTTMSTCTTSSPSTSARTTPSPTQSCTATPRRRRISKNISRSNSSSNSCNNSNDSSFPTRWPSSSSSSRRTLRRPWRRRSQAWSWDSSSCRYPRDRE